MALKEQIVIEVNSDADMPENIFDGVVRTLKYPSGMEMTVGVDRELFSVFETHEEFETRISLEDKEFEEALAANPGLKAELDSVDALERWLS